MYNKGAAYIEITMAANLTIWQVRKWVDERRITRRPKRDHPNKKPTTQKRLIKRASVMQYRELYAQVYDDTEIASKVGVNQYAVTSWRQRNNLPRVMQ